MQLIAPVDDPYLAPLQALFFASLEEMPAQIRQEGQRLLEQISTANWHLEWNLPRWLGETFELSLGATQDLILGNIYGLAFVRLQDNLNDGESIGQEQEAILLGKALFSSWLGQYRQHFVRNSQFWQYLDQYVGQWLRATLEFDGPCGYDLRSGNPESLLWLAERGAPLKVCCAAASLLAGKEQLLPRLLDCMDHFLAGAVLIDHASDWEFDLKASHYNAFSAFIAPQVDQKLKTNPHRQTFLEELYLGDGPGSYFQLAQQQFQRASEVGRELGILGMEPYLNWLRSKTAIFGERLANDLRHRLQVATADLMRFI